MIDGWLAYDSIEPISQPWEHTGTIAAALQNAVAALCAANGVEVQPLTPTDFIPGDKPPAKLPEPMTTEELQATMADHVRRYSS